MTVKLESFNCSLQSSYFVYLNSNIYFVLNTILHMHVCITKVVVGLLVNAIQKKKCFAPKMLDDTCSKSLVSS